jgi:o-succinylbenzoate synthase
MAAGEGDQYGGVPPAPIDAVELRRIRLPLRAPFQTAHELTDVREILLVHVFAAGAEGWSECVAGATPTYLAEVTRGEERVLLDHLLPSLFAAGPVDGGQLATAFRDVKGHRPAKAALETAVLDAQLRAQKRNLADYLGADPRPLRVGVAVGLAPSTDALLAEVTSCVEAGYTRVKLKIAPGRDLEPVGAVRAAFPDLALQVDANGSYTLDDAEHLAGLDDFDLLLIEQPLGDDDLAGHAELARRLRTPICLDEAIHSLDHCRSALALGAARVIAVKPGRVGGLLAAKAIHDLCRDRGVDAWVGGMLETGIGRAANLALAALPGFTLPGDLSASARYWEADITPPFELEGGTLAVPTGAGIGVDPDLDFLERITTDRRMVRR